LRIKNAELKNKNKKLSIIYCTAIFPIIPHSELLHSALRREGSI